MYDVLISVRQYDMTIEGLTPKGVEWAQLYFAHDVIDGTYDEAVIFKYEAERRGLRVELRRV